MNKATLVEYNLNITLGCPKCDYLFQLSNYSIPTEVSTYQVCENCKIPLEVSPISIKIKLKNSSKLKKNKNKYKKQGKSVQQAKLVIKSYGFTEQQFNNAFNEVENLYEPGWEPIETKALIKEILARIDNKHEPATT